MTIFEQVKSAVDMKNVAETYGLHINRSGMVICPFHNEKTPSAKIYPDNFHCFGCGIHLDAVGFTQKFFNLDRPFDSVKKLNQDFGLNLTLGQAPTVQEQNEYQKRMAEKQAYMEWENFAFKVIHDLIRLLREWKNLTPENESEKFACGNIYYEKAEFFGYDFINADKDKRLEMKFYISKISEFLNSHNLNCISFLLHYSEWNDITFM